MSSVAISVIVFACVLAGAGLGIALRAWLPEQHLNADSKSAVTIAMGLVATLSALVLGLLVGAAKQSYDAQSTAVTNMAAQIIMLDRVLAHYGPEAKPIRVDLYHAADRFLHQTWRTGEPGGTLNTAPSAGPEALLDKLQMLVPQNEEQRQIRSVAYSMILTLGQTRWLMFEERTMGVSMPMLIVLVFWLTAIFVSFGLFAPTNPTVVSAFCVAALSVSAAILLILEMYKPYKGLIQISSTPIRTALSVMGQ
jgi:hypothetical protein